MADETKPEQSLDTLGREVLSVLLDTLSPEQRATLEKRGVQLPPTAPPREPKLSPEDRASLRDELGIDELEARIDVLERFARNEGNVPQPRPAPAPKADATDKR